MLRTVLRAAIVLTALIAPLTLSAQEEPRTERIRFEAGASSAVVEGSITGSDGIDYLLGASEGQTMTVTLTTGHTATYFNVIPPSETDVAVYIGSTEGNRFEGSLSESGDYKVRVYMMRSAARRNETADYRLEVTITDRE